jgi:hypothetical protein
MKIYQANCFFLLKGPAADATDAPQPWGLWCNPVMKMILLFQFTGASVEWNWQEKTEVFGENPVPVPLCLPQIPHRPTPGSNPGLRGEKPVTNCLSLGLSKLFNVFLFFIPCIVDNQFITLTNKIHHVFHRYFYYFVTLSIATCFNPQGIIIKNKYQILLHEKSCNSILYFSLDKDPLWSETCSKTQCYNIIQISKEEHCTFFDWILWIHLMSFT